jgi:hypothetical protein
LIKFPFSEKTTQEFLEFKVSWDKLFNVKNKYQLLYSLKILEGILLKDPKATTKFETNIGAESIKN